MIRMSTCPSTTFSMNYATVDIACENISKIVSGLQQVNVSLQSTISRLSNCRGTKENPHDHSAEISGYQATINQNNNILQH